MAAISLSSLRASVEAPRAKPLALGVDALDAALPDAGLPRSGVIELAAPAGLGRATQIALWACASAQAEARAASHDGDSSWCAWIDPSATLYAPGVAQAGGDLERLLVVRPEPKEIAKVAVRVVASRAFSVVVIDRAGVPGARVQADRSIRWDVAVRRLALANERPREGGAGGVVLVLSELEQARAAPLPVAMRLELTRPGQERIALRVARDRRGQTGRARIVPLIA